MTDTHDTSSKLALPIHKRANGKDFLTIVEVDAIVEAVGNVI